MMLRPLLILSFAASLASAFNINATPQKIPAIAPTAEQCTRRNILHRTASLGFLTIISTAAAAAPANADVIRSPGKCANGEGEGCDSLAEDNELIQSLQKKSSENREANQREALNAYYMKNYPDVFAASGKRMVKKMDGSFVLYSPEEVKDLTDEGKITIEYPKSKGGRILDLTQKPVLVLNNE
mmetsp:Transcript_20436/g.37518  ORF Transcript_20436/g.37518 Transcript_20436/m.37518 type:complete len:184 (+) Transcript_20436:50-601(+)|eukprot:CAMPEP_0201867750 /NCGR_PEP_ID=MMETSP0902-20130614/1885_1 /ASSEMBLY_ACC=CAM_ASM_000551 /TAXON_ID=420261 /ORGANISM="Thalassiosira antarctica, Strain CCMP982" /LENGTH=183 /DNA_ID=CAMNT_0048392971 /DNA_START=28 /DNA_END=579 /DNA_ORIENTATION=+